jgi:hypothetical protein
MIKAILTTSVEKSIYKLPYRLRGPADYSPVILSQVPDLIRRGMALIQTSLQDKHGCISFGVSVDIRYTRVGFFFGFRPFFIAFSSSALVNPPRRLLHERCPSGSDGRGWLQKCTLAKRRASPPGGRFGPPPRASEANRFFRAILQEGSTKRVRLFLCDERVPQYVEVPPNIKAKRIISYFSAVLSY